MAGHDMTVSQMHWKPALIKLTQIANPDHDGAEPTACYIDPQDISMISRGLASFTKKLDDGTVPGPSEREYHPAQPCTFVVIGHSLALQVVEMPERVALLRDRALGHGQRPKAV